MFRRRKKSPQPPPRLARLRPEFATLYPKVRPERWMAAEKVARKLKARATGPARALPDAHFEFSGGDPRNPAWLGLRQRRGDLAGDLEMLESWAEAVRSREREGRSAG